MEKIKIQDDSGDKKYFTIIPNYILNHSTLWDREVYIQMKRITGEEGTCWTSRRTLAKQCGISERRLDKSLTYLVAHKWISKIGVKKVLTNGGIQEVNEYKVADLWKMNVDYYDEKGIAPETPPSHKGVARLNQRGSTDEAKGIAPGAYKEEPYINKNHTNSELCSQVVSELIKLFEDINPTCKTYYGNKTQRMACQFLLDTYGFEKVSRVIKEVLPKTNGKEFFPTITTPVQLKDKWSSLEANYRSYVSKQQKIKQNAYW